MLVMRWPVVRITLPLRAVAMVVVLAPLVCAVSAARAEMVQAPGEDCSGARCEQQIACLRSDQAAAPSRQGVSLDGLPAAAVTMAPIAPRRVHVTSLPLSDPPSRPVAPLAARSPPAA